VSNNGPLMINYYGIVILTFERKHTKKPALIAFLAVILNCSIWVFI